MKLRFLAALPLALLGACSSPNPYAGPAKQLAAEEQRVDSGELAAAARNLESLVAQTDRGDSGARLQAFYAAYLLARAHSLASVGAPFLAEPTTNTGLGGGAPRHSGMGHVVAASMYSALAQELSRELEKAPHEHKGVKLLPADLESFPLKDVRANLALRQMVALARLGFEERVREFVAGSAELHSFDSARALLERLRFEPALAPWIHASVFEYLRRSESTEPEAYKFAVQAVILAERAGGAFDAREREELSKWIREGSNFEYRCPDHRILVQPELGRCQEIGCQRALHEFTPQRKSR